MASQFDRSPLPTRRWIWFVPVSWFASIEPALSGIGRSARTLLATLAALVLTITALALAAGRLSLEFAERLSAASTTAERPRKGLMRRIPGFREGEAYAIATLVRAQFRYDMRFRFAILSIVPVTIFYIFPRDGGRCAQRSIHRAAAGRRPSISRSRCCR